MSDSLNHCWSDWWTAGRKDVPLKEDQATPFLAHRSPAGSGFFSRVCFKLREVPPVDKDADGF